jgi:hypothetical protein
MNLSDAPAGSWRDSPTSSRAGQARPGRRAQSGTAWSRRSGWLRGGGRDTPGERASSGRHKPSYAECRIDGALTAGRCDGVRASEERRRTKGKRIYRAENLVAQARLGILEAASSRGSTPASAGRGLRPSKWRRKGAAGAEPSHSARASSRRIAGDRFRPLRRAAGKRANDLLGHPRLHRFQVPGPRATGRRARWRARASLSGRHSCSACSSACSSTDSAAFEAPARVAGAHDHRRLAAVGLRAERQCRVASGQGTEVRPVRAGQAHRQTNDSRSRSSAAVRGRDPLEVIRPPMTPLSTPRRLDPASRPTRRSPSRTCASEARPAPHGPRGDRHPCDCWLRPPTYMPRQPVNPAPQPQRAGPARGPRGRFGSSRIRRSTTARTTHVAIRYLAKGRDASRRSSISSCGLCGAHNSGSPALHHDTVAAATATVAYA